MKFNKLLTNCPLCQSKLINYSSAMKCSNIIVNNNWESHFNYYPDIGNYQIIVEGNMFWYNFDKNETIFVNSKESYSHLKLNFIFPLCI